jgi:hypothetical protein
MTLGCRSQSILLGQLLKINSNPLIAGPLKVDALTRFLCYNQSKERGKHMRGVLAFVFAATVMLPAYGLGHIWRIEPDGTGDAPTIAAGIDSASSGDTVLVACGTYYESDISLKSGIILVSETGEAGCVTINAEGVGGPVLACNSCESLTIIGFTMTGGWPGPGGPGGMGGMEVRWSSEVSVVSCDFVDNCGGMYCEGSSAVFKNCTFNENLGVAFSCGDSPRLEYCVFIGDWLESAGGLVCHDSSAPVLVNCTFCGSDADQGGPAIRCGEQSTPILENTIIVFSAGPAIVCEGELSDATLTCCDIYGNHGGDWTGCILDQYGLNGNFSADPLFCDMGSGDLTLEDCSPCLPGYHPSGYDCVGVIGARVSGCSCGTPAEPSTWSLIKSTYR